MSISELLSANPSFLLLLCSVLSSRRPDVHALAAKVDQRYDHMHTLEAQFTETYTGAGMTRTESGTLLLKKPGRMRWDYDQPRPKMFLTDGQHGVVLRSGRAPGAPNAGEAARRPALAAALPVGQDQAGEGTRRTLSRRR